jgi:cellulose synthase/poly-beta-1,6-N-acetylglucosamine synthase-like glycosyltransferase
MITASLTFFILFISCFIIVSAAYVGYSFFLRILRKRVAKKSGSSSNEIDNTKAQEPFVSIIIPTFNEAKVIQKKIENTIKAINGYEKNEIIVVDDGSTDDTFDKIKEINEKLEKKVKIIACFENKGKPFALNVAYKASQGDIIVVTDADILISKESIISLISNFLDPTIGAACGREVIENPNDNFATRLENYYKTFEHTSRMSEKLADLPIIPFSGGISAFRRELYTPLSTSTVGDDNEIAISIWKKGYRIIYEPGSHALEHSPCSLRNLYKQKKRRARAQFYLLWRHKNLIFNKEAGYFGRIKLPMLVLQYMVCPFLILLGLISLISFFLLSQNSFWMFSIIFMAFMAGIMFIMPSKQSVKEIPYIISGLCLYQSAMINAALETLLRKRLHWVKGERR